jgi:hypothetical protein
VTEAPSDSKPRSRARVTGSWCCDSNIEFGGCRIGRVGTRGLRTPTSWRLSKTSGRSSCANGAERVREGSFGTAPRRSARSGASPSAWVEAETTARAEVRVTFVIFV